VQSTLENAERFFLSLPGTIVNVITAEDVSMDVVVNWWMFQLIL